MNHKYQDNRLDASQNAFLNRELEHIRTTLYEELLGPNKGRSLLPVTNEVDSGAESDTYNVMQMFGKAKVGGGAYSTTPPRADVARRKVTASIVPVVNAYGFHLQEIRNSAKAGVPLPMYKGRAAKMTMEKEIDELLLIGNSAEGLAGLFNLSGALSLSPLSGISGDDWDSKTSDEVVADLFAMEHQIIENSKETLVPDTLVLPLSQKHSIATRRMRDGSDVTIMQFFLANSDNINRIESSSRLETLGAGSTKRAVCYKNDPMMIEAVIPQEFEQLPPQQQNYETIINCHMRYGGIRTYQPESVLYMDGI